MHVHEDDRRLLIEWANGEFKCAKVVTAKVDCVVGDHHHRHKDERFLLLSGRASVVKIGGEVYTDVKAPQVFDVPRGRYHSFALDAGSVLLGVATAEFDPADEVKGEP